MRWMKVAEDNGAFPPIDGLHVAAKNYMTAFYALTSRCSDHNKPSRERLEIWSAMRSAKVYSVDPAVVVNAEKQAFYGALNEIAGSVPLGLASAPRATVDVIAWLAGFPDAATLGLLHDGRIEEIIESQSNKIVAHFRRRGHEIDLLIPFDNVYIALNEGHESNEMSTMAQYPESQKFLLNRELRQFTLGYLLRKRNGLVYVDSVQAMEPRNKSLPVSFVVDETRDPGAKGFPFWALAGGEPVILDTLVKRIVQKKFVQQDDSKFKKAFRASRKRLGMRGEKKPIPPPFYVIQAGDVIPETTPNDGTGGCWTLGHRIDVAGHWRMRIQRGELPIDNRLFDDLIDKRGYQFFYEYGEEPFEALVSLNRRGIRPCGQGEWLAIKRTWIRSHERGPKDGPKVPAVRLVR